MHRNSFIPSAEIVLLCVSIIDLERWTILGARLAMIVDTGGGVEPVRHEPWPGPLTLRGRLGYGFVRSVGGALSNRGLR